MPIQTFKIVNHSADVKSKTEELKIWWDNKAKRLMGTAWVRGDDYDSDANKPYLELKWDGTSVKTQLMHDLSNTRYKKHTISWDPATYFAQKINTGTATLVVNDEDGTAEQTVSQAVNIDLEPEVVMITPKADYIQGDSVVVEFSAYFQGPNKISPQIKWADNAKMVSSTDVYISHFRPNSDTTTYLPYTHGVMGFIGSIGDTKMRDLDVTFNTNYTYMAGLRKFKGTIDISSSDEADQLYIQIDWNSVKF